MKKILWILATLALFFTGDRLGGLLLKKAVDASQFRYSRLYAGDAQSDLLFVGNSRGLIFYQPYIEEITGKKTFNISYNGMPIDLAKTMIKDYIERYRAPQKMIVDVTMCDRENPGLISGFNLYSPYSNNLTALIKGNDKTTYPAGRLSHLYRYNSEIFQRALFYLKKNDEDWLLDRVINSFMEENVINEKEYTLGITDTLVNHLEEMVHFAKSKNIEVHLLINPYYPAFAKKITNLPDVKSKIEEATGMKVHDYSTAVKDNEGFADYQHLNKYGAQLYLDKLKKDGILN